MKYEDAILIAERVKAEMTEEETADEYLDRLVKEATPAWQGVDPQQFLDEVRGSNARLEWKKGAPEEAGIYVMVTKNDVGRSIVYYRPDHPVWGFDEILFYIGPIPPIPPVPQNDEK